MSRDCMKESRLRAGWDEDEDDNDDIEVRAGVGERLCTTGKVWLLSLTLFDFLSFLVCLLRLSRTISMLSKWREGSVSSTGSGFTRVGGVCGDASRADAEREIERDANECEEDEACSLPPFSWEKALRELACSAVRNWRIWSLRRFRSSRVRPRD